MKELRERRLNVRQTMLWMMAGTLTYLGTQWLITVLVPRLSGFAAAGDYSLALSSSNIAYAIALFGMRPFQISDTRQEFADPIYLGSRVVSSLLAILVTAAVSLISDDFSRIWPLILMMLVFRLTEGWMDVLHGVLQHHGRMDLLSVALILRGVIGTALFALVLRLSDHLLLAVTAMTAVSVLALLLIEWPLSRHYVAHDASFRQVGGWPRVRMLLQRCLPLLAGNLSYSLILFLPRSMISNVWGQAMLGYYGSISAPLLVLPVFVSYLYTPYMPIFAEQFRQGQIRRLIRLAARILLVVLALSALLLLGAWLWGAPLLSLLFRPEILLHIDLLLPIVGSVICLALVYFGNALLTSIRQIRWTLYGALAATLFVALAAQPAVRHWGPNGASFVLIAAQLVQLLILAWGLYHSLVRRTIQADVVS